MRWGRHPVVVRNVVHQPHLFPCQQLYDAFPALMKHLPGPHQRVHANYGEIMGFLQKETERHQQERNPDDSRDYIDVYLTEMERVRC